MSIRGIAQFFIYALLIASCSSTTSSVGNVAEYKNGKLITNAEVPIDSSLAYLGTFEYTPEKKLLINLTDEKLELISIFENNSKNIINLSGNKEETEVDIYDSFIRALKSGNENFVIKDESSIINQLIIEELKIIYREYRETKDLKRFPPVPSFIVEGNLSSKNRFGILNFYTQTEKASRTTGPFSQQRGVELSIGFDNKEYETEFISLLIDLKKHKVSGIYTLKEGFEISVKSLQYIFEGMAISLKNEEFISPLSIGLISDWSHNVTIYFRDGSLYFGKIKYDGDYMFEIESSSYSTNHNLSDVAKIVDDFSGTQLYPFVIESY